MVPSSLQVHAASGAALHCLAAEASYPDMEGSMTPQAAQVRLIIFLPCFPPFSPTTLWHSALPPSLPHLF